MSDEELHSRMAEIIWQNSLKTMDGARDVAREIIDDLGLTETDASRHNGMVKYETRWLPRSGE